jgi:hypothetical protein
MSSSSRTALYYVVAACAAALTMSSDAFQSPRVVVTPSRRPLSGLSMSRNDGGNDPVGSRRMAIESVFGLAASSAAAVLVAASSAPQQALALDMDAFVNTQVRQDGKQNAT